MTRRRGDGVPAVRLQSAGRVAPRLPGRASAVCGPVSAHRQDLGQPGVDGAIAGLRVAPAHRVAGPGPADGHPAGTVHVAVASPWGTVRRRRSLEGDRSAVREGATTAVLALAVGLLDASADR